MVKLGIQLYTLRDEMQRDPIGTIGRVAQIGYKNLEVANHNAENDYGVGFGVSAEEINAILKKSDSHIVSAHVFPFDEKNCGPVIEYNLAIGNHYIGNSFDTFSSRDEVLAKCERYNKFGEICKKAGISFLYHNHFHEFQQFGDKSAFELICENTDPDYVGFELDTFWVMRAGVDYLQLMRDLGKRVKLVHQKDFSKTTKSPINLLAQIPQGTEITQEVFMQHFCPDDFAEVGTGTMDIQATVDVANEIGGVEYVILEQDFVKMDPYESIKLSMEGFKKLKGLEI